MRQRLLCFPGSLKSRREDALQKALGTLFWVLLLCIPLIAQVKNGLEGTVTDASAATIRAAHITATNVATGVAAEAQTSSGGVFTIIGLLPGQYSVSINATEFRKVQTEITVEIAKMSSVTVRMVPGSPNEIVDVVASGLSLENSNPTVGTTIERVEEARIETNSLARQIDSFMYLATGVQGNAGSHNINGGVTFENAVQFNGVPVAVADYPGNQTNINPPFEMVNEFRVNSSTFDHRHGIGMGAVAYSMRSGTNRFHGHAFEILRNRFFDSDEFFPTRFVNGHPAPPVDPQNKYGFSIGGPVTIPHVTTERITLFSKLGDALRSNSALRSPGQCRMRGVQ
jgi:hypothetical protein